DVAARHRAVSRRSPRPNLASHQRQFPPALRDALVRHARGAERGRDRRNEGARFTIRRFAGGAGFGGGQASRVAPRVSGFFIALNRRLTASSQNALFCNWYSTSNTALPAAMNGARRSHSEYWKHCSVIAQSKSSTRSGTWDRSFFNPTESPRACAAE